MNTKIILYLLAVSCGFAVAHAENTESNNNKDDFDLPEALANMRKKVVDNIMFNIEQLREMQAFIISALTATNKDLNALLTNETNYSRMTVNDAIAQGKNAEHCFQRTKENLENIKLVIEFQFTLCVNVSYRQMLDSFHISLQILDKGHYVIERLNTVLVICDKKLFAIQACRAYLCKNCKTFIEQFDKKSNWHKYYRKIIHRILSQNIYTCLRKQAIEGTKKFQNAKLMTKSCIEGAE